MKKIRLLTPGPTPVPERLALRMAQPIVHHRSPESRGKHDDALPEGILVELTHLVRLEVIPLTLRRARG